MNAAFGLKRLAIAAAALIAAVLIAVIGIASLLPAASVRDAVKAEIRGVTGLDPVLGDDISLSLFPSAACASTTSCSPISPAVSRRLRLTN